MDSDDIDYYPRRGKRAERADAARGEWTKEQTLARFRKEGMFFHEIHKGDLCVFRSPGKPTVDFYTRKSRWQVRGAKKTQHGTVDQFIRFLGDLWGEPVTRSEPTGGLGTIECSVRAPETIKAFSDPAVRATRTNADDYDAWIEMGLRFYGFHGGREHGLNLWREWSKQSAKFDESVLIEKWRTFATGNPFIRTDSAGYTLGPVTRSTPEQLRSKPAQLSALGKVMAYDEFDHLTPEQQAAFDPAGQDQAKLVQKRERVRTDSAGYTLGPVSDGGVDPRDRE